MGYNTDFSGAFALTPALNEKQVAYLKAFSESRRMKRDAHKCSHISDPLREAVGLPVGIDGEFCVFSAADGNLGQNKDSSILDYNHPANTQPYYSLWCKWEPSQDGTKIQWDGAEKFYEYTEWIKYINENFLKRWGITINGEVKWRGEDFDDVGIIYAQNGHIFTSDENDLQLEQGNVFEGEFEEVKDVPRIGK
ncbi:hypothetical protein [Serratia sp. Se-RSBMAAmG]|uniref:hypothetical protein n=1 Tax=Serratia sp. Se-RSBMAAmG TaxID=3043305 RepID=UPI0024AEC27A|nr:hypothetical protein [Serratia sp. Se-RSBMAAmG]MDI6976083.1 hypothetical protein [Serratia sp. Se-RSBMAAmG]